MRRVIRAVSLGVRLSVRLAWAARIRSEAPLLGPRVAEQAGRLRSLYPDNTKVLYLVGWVHWMRYQAAGPDDDTEEDRRVATEMFRGIVGRYPDHVPVPLREFLENEHADKQTAIRLLSPRELLGHEKLPAYADLTDFTTWNPDDERPLVFVSHRWITGAHPDPDGRQFLELVRRLTELLDAHPGLEDCGVFYDYWSMPQQPRTVEEEEIFRRELGRLGELAGAADHMIILSEGYTDYRDRAWCVFEMFVASTGNLDWAETPTSNIHFFSDQTAMEVELAFLRTTMFQTVLGRQVHVMTAWHHRYRPDLKEAEAISAIFHHLGTCRTTDPADAPLVKLQLVRSMNLMKNLTPYGRLLLGINKFFDTTYCVLTNELTPLPATLHFRQPGWARIPAYHQTGERENHVGPFCLSPEQVETLRNEGGSAFSALRFTFDDVRKYQRAGNWEQFYVQSYELIRPVDDPFPTIGHVVHTVLELGPVPLMDLHDGYAYFPLADPWR